MARVLMCRPDHYGIRYEINPWMRTSRNALPERARDQWQALYHTLARRMGVQVELVEPTDGWPDMVFTANAGLVVGGRFIASNFRHEQRAGEAPLFARWFADHGYVRIELPPARVFEGEGDALWAGPSLLAGYRFRSDLDSHRLLAEVLGCRVISLELIDNRFYHLDTCLAPLDERSAVWFPPAFDDYARRAVRDLFADLIELTPDEAMRFAANAVVADRSVVLNAGCPKLAAELAARGYEVFDVELGEFLKAGGAAKCLVLFLER
jgi:N-dimethylarginine dimethylaminohydrolase